MYPQRKGVHQKSYVSTVDAQKYIYIAKANTPKLHGDAKEDAQNVPRAKENTPKLCSVKATARNVHVAKAIAPKLYS